MPDGKDVSTDWKAILIGILTAILFGLAGFFFLRDKNGSMGAVLFLLLPSAAGFAVAVVTKPPKIISASLVMAVILCFFVFLITGAEGWVCVLMATPLIVLGLAIGSLCGYLFRRHIIDRSRFPQTMKCIALLFTPLLLLGANTAERPLRSALRTETFVTSQVLNAEPDQVWQALKSVESIDAPRPFLLRIGLPVPVRCELEGESVGSKRICYFDSGHIEERITEWNPPFSMKMQVTEAKLPGRHWLSFQDASYEIRKQGSSTLVIRKTTINSRLQPAWYWRRLEELGVQTEHDYLFESVRRGITRDQ